eukprot:jgi/Mesen1/4127/ME000218S03241
MAKDMHAAAPCKLDQQSSFAILTKQQCKQRQERGVKQLALLC